MDIAVLAKDSKIKYTREDISNYFLGVFSADQDHNNNAFKYLKKVQSLKEIHSKFNIEFIRTLVLLEKFDQANTFAKKVWEEDELFFEADLLIGLNYFLNNDYKNSEKHFKRLNKISRYNLFFENFIGNVLLAWNEAAKDNEKKSYEFLEKVPRPYAHIIKIQKSFYQCYFKTNSTHASFNKLVEDEDYNFSRYNFFLINQLLQENKLSEAKKIIKDSRKNYNSNLLLQEVENFLLNKKSDEIKYFFNCENPSDIIAEFFYILANLYSGEKDYQLSNFYLNVSLFLNNKFLPNKALLAENYFFQKQYKSSKEIYNSIKQIGPAYSWYASKSIASILLNEKGKEFSINNLEKDFKSISNPNFEHYYDLANYYKDYDYYKKSIEFYSLALNKIKKDHFLVPKILDRRGTSYERLGDWKSAEKDLLASLEILPDQPQVLNYLAYTWVDKGINLDKGLEMLKKATKLRKNDGYIIDSLGWAYYAKKNYIEAEFYLQQAVQLLPSDPIIIDHYADTLWMLNKDIQARYFWNYILNLDSTEQELRDIVTKKLLFGVDKNYN